MARTVNHNYDIEALRDLHRQCESEKPIRDALGYLSLWGLESYPVVDLSILGKPGDMEILAYYRRFDGAQASFVIGAVWRKDEQSFSFHS